MIKLCFAGIFSGDSCCIRMFLSFIRCSLNSSTAVLPSFNCLSSELDIEFAVWCRLNDASSPEGM